MSAASCECPCLGCEYFCVQDPPAEGQDAHRTRLLLALDLSIAAACRTRGIAACNGQEHDAHATGCDMGALHSRVGELAVELATAIDDPSSSKQAVRAGDALEALLTELRRVIGDKPRVS